jgi:dCTP deaminase
MIRHALSEEEQSFRLVIDPFPHDTQFQPASVDLRLGGEFKQFSVPLNARNAEPLDPLSSYPDSWVSTTKIPTELGEASAAFILDPGVFTLATTLERVKIPNNLVARVEGKSSLARLGLLVHVTAGFIDPGFHGTITLEMMNLSPRPIDLTVGMRICQLSFSRVDGRVERPYGHPALRSKYQGQQGVTEARPDAENKQWKK